MKQFSSLSSFWARVGVLYNARPARSTPDLEQLLLDTAHEAPHDARMLGAAASWLAQYARLVARHRLTGKVEREDREASAIVGLMLDAAKEASGETALCPVASVCERAAAAHPLFEMDRKNAALAEFARERASPVSLRWNLWADVEIRPKIIRPPGWVFGANPSFRTRAILGGGLRASALACLEWDAPQGASEAELARLCRVTRKAMHEALDHLEFCQLIQRARVGRCYRVTLVRRTGRAAV